MPVSLEYVAKETATNLWRNRMMTLAAILTVAVSLSLVGTALLLREAVNRQIGQWGSSLVVRIFVEPAATNQQIASIRSMIQQTPQITHSTYLDHQQSLNLAKQLFAGNNIVIQTLTPATTPPVFEVQLKNPADAATVVATFNGGVPGVYHVAAPTQTIHALSQISTEGQIVLLVIAIVLLISALVLILNAIRMAIFARRREVSVMKLVGATNWFIRIPFMLEGLVQSLLGAMVAVLIVLLANIGVGYLIHHYRFSLFSSAVLPLHDLVLTEVVVVLFGIVIGVAGSVVAVRRFLDV